MCQLKSCLVLKDRVYCPDYDSHQDMLDKLGIKDDYLGASKTFVRVELTPPDGMRSLMEPLDRWTLKVDQDVTPEWWDAEADRQRVEEAVEAWRGEHVFTEGEHSIGTGIVYALSSATVTAYDNVTVALFPAEPIPPAVPRSALVAAWDNYGTLLLAAGGIGLAALVGALVLWWRQRRPAPGSGGGNLPAAPEHGGDGAAAKARRPSLRAVGLDGAQSAEG